MIEIKMEGKKMNGKEKKFNELIENGSFLEALNKADSKDDIKDTFQKFGLDLTNEEVDVFVEAAEKELSGNELYEDDLEPVSGGIAPEVVLGWMWSGAKAVAKKAWNLGKKFATWEDKH